MYAKYAPDSRNKYRLVELRRELGPNCTGEHVAINPRSLAIVIDRLQWYGSVAMMTFSSSRFFISRTYAFVSLRQMEPPTRPTKEHSAIIPALSGQWRVSTMPTG